MKEEYFNNNNTENILRSSGSYNDPSSLNFKQYFYLLYNENPIITSCNTFDFYNCKTVEKQLNHFYPDNRLIVQENNLNLNTKKLNVKQQIIELKYGIIIHLQGDTFMLKENNIKPIKNESSDFFVYEFKILSTEQLSTEDVKNISSIFNKSKVNKSISTNIGLVSSENGNFYVKDFDIKVNKLELLDLHYGDNFTIFNKQLVDKLSTTDKGLTLLHGQPGTGKTTYIRYLIKQLKDIDPNNSILYFPHSMIDCITDPSFINFISNWSTSSDGKKYILIEDAEPLLVSRDTNRNIGITNLLNLTDGLLNDVFNIQVIATFNTNISNLDKALLRPERLIARKEFKSISNENTIKLAKHLKIDINKLKNENMTIAEIYGLLNENSTLEHDLCEKPQNIGFFK